MSFWYRLGEELIESSSVEKGLDILVGKKLDRSLQLGKPIIPWAA